MWARTFKRPRRQLCAAAAQEHTVQIDRSGLLQSAGVPSRARPSETPLETHIREQILVRGPLTVADYMRQCLLHPEHGYYSQGDVFGRGGDFTTAPEISQVFGECVAVWLRHAWAAMGSPARVALVELGPGRGTLMADILRASQAFPDFRAALDVHLVEASAGMQAMQRATLGALGAEQQASWHSTLSSVPQGAPRLFVAQELFDALPVHQFVKTAEYGWCERLVDVEADAEAEHAFRFVLSPGATPAAAALLGAEGALRRSLAAAEARAPAPDAAALPAGVDAVEVSGEGLALAQAIAAQLAADGGAALLVDYGNDGAVGNSLRGIREHAFVSPLEAPGKVDLSIDVDFNALRAAAEGAGAAATATVPQGQFLLGMGVVERVEDLINQPGVSDEQADGIEAAYERLVDPEQMGQVYKALAVVGGGVGVGDVAGFSV